MDRSILAPHPPPPATHSELLLERPRAAGQRGAQELGESGGQPAAHEAASGAKESSQPTYTRDKARSPAMDASHITDTVSVGDTAHGSARATVAGPATPTEADQAGVEAEQPEGSGSPTCTDAHGDESLLPNNIDEGGGADDGQEHDTHEDASAGSTSLGLLERLESNVKTAVKDVLAPGRGTDTGMGRDDAGGPEKDGESRGKMLGMAIATVAK